MKTSHRPSQGNCSEMPLFPVVASAFCSTAVLVGLGVLVGATLLNQDGDSLPTTFSLISSATNWDGNWYVRIANNGYSYLPGVPSRIAFFPAYPLAGRGLSYISGLAPEHSLLTISHLCLFGIIAMLPAYVRVREIEPDCGLSEWTIVAFVLWPLTFFFHMAYSEALFVLVALVALYAMQRCWPMWIIATVVGLATACRPVGVALLLPLAFHLWVTWQSNSRFFLNAAALTPVACWGMLAYMLYQYNAFGEPLAFVKTQNDWAGKFIPLQEQIANTLLLEPIWSKYDPSSSGYWARLQPGSWIPILNLDFMNPIYFLGTTGLVVLGMLKGW